MFRWDILSLHWQAAFAAARSVKQRGAAMRQQQVELLAPAGSFESMTAAIAAGADAVYIGGNRFGARAYADNLDENRMLEAIDYAHLHGSHLYMTVNTLVKEGEIGDLYAYLEPYYLRGLDGVIVQDLGVFAFIRKYFPSLPIHASTQMTVTGAYGAKVLKDLGAARIVTARELSLDEIAQIRETVDVEIESFIHGALCYCYSGQCLLSSLAGGRSGNRGRCAQPCRLPYDVKRGGRLLNRGNEKYVLSLKDLCTLELIPDLIEAGVFSLKIEGRMKSPRYTAGVVSVYRKYVDRFLEQGRKGYLVEEKDRQMLLELFDRGGFTKGYYTQHNGADMVAVKEKPAFRQGDEELFRYLDEHYVLKKQQEGICGLVKMQDGQPVEMELCCGDTSVTVTGEVVQKAQNQPITDEKLKKQISKTGNTPFTFEKLDTVVEKAVFLPVLALNELRRNGLERLQEAMLLPFRRAAAEQGRDCLEMEEMDGKGGITVSPMELHVLLERPDTLGEILKNPDVTEVMVEADGFAPESWQGVVSQCHQAGKRCMLAMPPIFRTEAVDFFDKGMKALVGSGFDGLLLRTLEEVEYLREKQVKLPWIADHNLYTFNHLAAELVRSQGASRITLPLELNNRELLKTGSRGQELIVYGFLPMMVTAQCIKKTVEGCTRQPELLILKDRMGRELPVKNHCRFCYNTIYNISPLSLLGQERLVGDLEPGVIRLQFSMETPKEALEITKAYAASFLHGKTVDMPVSEYTRGHFKRGVE